MIASKTTSAVARNTGLFEMIVGVLTTCQFGTNSIIVLMFVESQRVHIQSTCKVCNKNLECSIK